jgi:hypothetical protein
MDLTDQIEAELKRAMQILGASEEEIAATDLRASYSANRALEDMGADIYLLCSVGSWGDTISDEEVLSDLRAWNSRGAAALEPHPRFA